MPAQPRGTAHSVHSQHILCIATKGVRGWAQLQHLQDVVAWLDVSDVNPLAVDVVPVQVPAAHRDALLPKVGTLVPLGHI